MLIEQWTVSDYEQVALHFDRHVIAPPRKIKGLNPIFLGGQTHSVQDVRGYFFPSSYDVPELRLDLIRGAFVSGAGFAFTGDGHAIHANAPAGSNDWLFRAPWADLGLKQTETVDSFECRRLDCYLHLENAYLIAGSSIGNYHHLLLDILPRLRALTKPDTREYIRSNGANPDRIPIVINHWFPTLADHVEQLGLDIARERFIPVPFGGSVRAEALFVPHYLDNFIGWVAPELIEFYRDALDRLRMREVKSPYGDKIFHLRRDVVNDRRAIRNVDELAAKLIKRGFREILPASMTFMEEMATFSQAEYIVGAMGSNLSNTVFCRPGARVLCVQSDASPFRLNAAVGAAAGHDVGYVFGKSFPETGEGEQVQFEIDPTAFDDALGRLLTSPA